MRNIKVWMKKLFPSKGDQLLNSTYIKSPKNGYTKCGVVLVYPDTFIVLNYFKVQLVTAGSYMVVVYLVISFFV